jgi:hypothetical protein
MRPSGVGAHCLAVDASEDISVTSDILSYSSCHVEEVEVGGACGTNGREEERV